MIDIDEVLDQTRAMVEAQAQVGAEDVSVVVLPRPMSLEAQLEFFRSAKHLFPDLFVFACDSNTNLLETLKQVVELIEGDSRIPRTASFGSEYKVRFGSTDMETIDG